MSPKKRFQAPPTKLCYLGTWTLRVLFHEPCSLPCLELGFLLRISGLIASNKKAYGHHWSFGIQHSSPEPEFFKLNHMPMIVFPPPNTAPSYVYTWEYLYILRGDGGIIIRGRGPLMKLIVPRIPILCKDFCW